MYGEFIELLENKGFEVDAYDNVLYVKTESIFIIVVIEIEDDVFYLHTERYKDNDEGGTPIPRNERTVKTLKGMMGYINKYLLNT